MTESVHDNCGCGVVADPGNLASQVLTLEKRLEAEQTDPRGDRITRWSAPIAPVGTPTGDGRTFAEGALTARRLPIALTWQRANAQGHSTATVVGTVDMIDFSANPIMGGGILFTPDPEQLPRLAEDIREARALAEAGVIGPSVDLDAMQYSVEEEDPVGQASAGQRAPKVQVDAGRISAVTLVPIPAFAETHGGMEIFEVDPAELEPSDVPEDALVAAVQTAGWTDLPVADADRPWDASAAVTRVYDWADGDLEKYGRAFLWRDTEPEAAGTVTAFKFPVADVVDGQLTVVPAALTAASGVLSGARGGTTIPEDDQARMQGVIVAIRSRTEPGASLTASAGVAVKPPSAWFANPRLEGPTPLTVTPEGRVYGHLATWGTCHIGFPGSCVTAPKSRANYAYFHTGEVATADGTWVDVGKISMGGGHADPNAGLQAALSHYDDSSSCIAAVRAGEDKHGIWVAGSLTPDATEFSVAQLRRSPLSGDWRRVGGRLELVAALAVNTPGFPVPRVGVEGGRQRSLVAAGAVQGELEETPDAPTTEGDLLTLADDERATMALEFISTLDNEGRQSRVLAAMSVF